MITWIHILVAGLFHHFSSSTTVIDYLFLTWQETTLFRLSVLYDFLYFVACLCFLFFLLLSRSKRKLWLPGPSILEEIIAFIVGYFPNKPFEKTKQNKTKTNGKLTRIWQKRKQSNINSQLKFNQFPSWNLHFNVDILTAINQIHHLLNDI